MVVYLDLGRNQEFDKDPQRNPFPKTITYI